MYLVIKELSDTAEDVIMVTQSLIKDIQSKQETVYRANAIRALCLITDVREKKERERNTQNSPCYFFSLP
jgi:coatomer protein complex subunit gamma